MASNTANQEEKTELSEKATDDTSLQRIPLLKLLIIGTLGGLILNWLTMYLNISLGLISGATSSFVLLLIGKYILGREASSRQNLTLISISNGATNAVEASIGLLFLIWLWEYSPTVFGLEFNPPSWLLPSTEVLMSKTVLSPEWILPLFTHWFLMIVPGISGIIFGFFLAPRFINNDKEYPFPGIVQRTNQINVLADKDEEKTQLFLKFLGLGFALALVTIFIPFIDFSSTSDGWIFGLAFGVVGVALFSVGYIIGSPKLTIIAGISSIVMYTILSPFLVKDRYLEAVQSGTAGTGFFDFYNFTIQQILLSFIIGFILAGVLLGPILAQLIKSLFRKKDNQDSSEENTTSEEGEPSTNSIPPNDESVSETTLNRKSTHPVKDFFANLTLVGWGSILIFGIVFILSFIFVQNLGIFPETEWWLILLVLFWILIIATFIQGYIAVTGIAKSSAAALPPFIFDMIPIFLVGGRGWVPYLATPKGEIDGTLGVVRSMKLAQINKVRSRYVMICYFVGYLAASVTTPIFALLLWSTLGIGTVQLPAPAFPLLGSLIAPFAAGSLDNFLSLEEILLGSGIGIIIGAISVTVAIGILIGLLFPPHMALMMSLGGVVRIITERKLGEETAKDKGSLAATGLSVGAALTIPIIILMVIFL